MRWPSEAGWGPGEAREKAGGAREGKEGRGRRKEREGGREGGREGRVLMHAPRDGTRVQTVYEATSFFSFSLFLQTVHI